MRTSSSMLVLLLVALVLVARAGAAVVSGAPHRLPGQGHGCGKAVENGAFYHKVGNFAVVIYTLWHDIKPAPVLECVVSASTRPARGGAVDYLLVLRVAGLGTCQAVVWGIPGVGSRDWKLKFFKPVAL